MATLRVSRTIYDRAACLVLEGDLDMSTGGLLAQALGTLLGETGTPAHHDRPSSLDLHGLNWAARDHPSDTKAASKGRSLRLMRGPAYVQRVFELTGAATLLEFHRSQPGGRITLRPEVR